MKQEKKDTANLAIFIQFAVVLFGLNLLFDRFTQIAQVYGLGGIRDLDAMLALSFTLPHFWTGLLVPICYLCALWAAAKCLRGFENTRTFSSTLLAGLTAIGANLVYGALAALIIVPSIEAWVTQSSRRFQLDWNVEAVTLGMLGVVLKLVAHRAEKLQTELDSIV
jgi:hypothetical protein